MIQEKGFEAYLVNIHANNYIGYDDEMSDSCEDFICDMNVNDMIRHADEFCMICVKKAIEEIVCGQ